LAQAVTEQNWFAVGVELIIVVLGVVIGFQVTAWGNERAAWAEEQVLLVGLKAEFNQVVSDLQKQLGTHQRVENEISITLDELTRANAAGIPTAIIADTTLAWAILPPTTQFSQGILKGMLAAGQLGLIRDQDLRTELAEWEEVMADVTEDEMASREIVIYHIDPALWRRMNVRPIRNYSLALRTGSPSEVEATSEVPADSELIGVFATRLHWQQHTIREFEGPQEAAEQILALINRSIN